VSPIAGVSESLPAVGAVPSPRCIQVVAGFARGKTNREIGKRLGISALTVKTHQRRIAAAFGCGSRAAIVDHAYRHGYLSGLEPEPREPATLTVREQQLLERMTSDLTTAEIGRDLGRSENTIKTRTRALFRKLKAADRAHAVALGWQQGLLPGGDPTHGLAALWPATPMEEVR
jgi:DNA-binding NarL/FixJ family response regulator